MASAGAPPPAAAMVPTEDALQTLIEYLVEPLLVGGSYSEPPIELQETVAKQIHAVVLLYNYYHRKQFPELQFLGFETFCKSAVVAKPSLSVYMKSVLNCRVYPKVVCGDSENLSITEMMVRNACKISKSLDASKSSPNMENWPISKVAVFLIDSAKENCLLRFTQGVWSLVEKDLATHVYNLDGPNMRKQKIKGRKTTSGSVEDKIYNVEDELEKLALAEVTKKTGIDQSNLCILEHHMAYSLSQDQTITQLYIMMYTKLVNDEFAEVSITDVLTSLTGPLFERSVTTEVTGAVEYYHLLPYADILSASLLRQTSKDPAYLLMSDAEKVEKCPSVELVGLSKMGVQGTNDKSAETASKMDILSEETPLINAIMNTKEENGSSVMGSRKAVYDKKADDTLSKQQHKLPLHMEKRTSGKKAISGTSLDTTKVTSSQIHVNTIENKFKDKVAMADSVEKLYSEKNIDGQHLTTTRFIQDQNEGALVTTDAVQERIAISNLPPVPLQLTSEQNEKLILTAQRKTNLFQSSLLVLRKRRNELCQQQRLLEDEAARCEMTIQSILNGGEENLASNIELILEACVGSWSSSTQTVTALSAEERNLSGNVKRRRLSDAVLSLLTPSQELDNICCDNNWILPRYSILPSFADGKFQANVSIQEMDFKLSCDGDLMSSPIEARESAASNLLNKLRSLASQVK